MKQLIIENLNMKNIIIMNELKRDEEGIIKVANNFMEEFDSVKRQYFFTLAVATKLTRYMNGKATNVDVHELYEQVKEIHYTAWDDWIHRHLENIDNQIIQNNQQNRRFSLKLN